VIVRDLRPGEARRFEEIRIAGWHAAYGGILHPDVLRGAVLDEERVAWRERWLADPVPGELTLVAEVDGDVVAGAYLRPSPEGEAELASLYVEPVRRGSGLGQALLEEGFARMPQQEQVLWTFEANAPARRFYERLGFATDGGRQSLPMLGDPVEVRYRRTRSRDST
jgi:ribosomal protein S18 acetylase RimI-like enzyme